MIRLLDMLRASQIGDDPVATLWHYARGRMADWENGTDGRVVWRARTHRGVQWLDKVRFPKSQLRYIYSPKFEVKYDTAFERTIRGCAESGVRKQGSTWIVENFIRGMVGLHRLGYAHSWEAWHAGKLVGGCFGVQLGSMMTCDSMFHTMSNASKAAYGQTLARLRERGFRVVDTNGVTEGPMNYGDEWTPRWKFERLLDQCLGESASLVDDRPLKSLPWEIRATLPVARMVRGGGRWVRRFLRRGGPGANAVRDVGTGRVGVDV